MESVTESGWFSGSLYLSRGIEIFSWICLTIGLFDFILQTLILLVVFISSALEPGKMGRRLFGVFIALFYLYLRVCMGLAVFTFFLPTVRSAMPPLFWESVLYVTTITALGLFAPSIFFGLFFMLKYGVSARKVDGVKRAGKEEPLQPLVALLMPIYNESPDILFRAIDSMIRVDYPPHKKHIFLSFDDIEETELYFQVLQRLGILTPEVYKDMLALENNNTPSHPSISKFPQRIDCIVENVLITVSRFPHGGKNSTQGHAYRIVQKLYGNSAVPTYVFSTDSDVILHENTLHNLVEYTHRNPDTIAVTGLLTCSTNFQVNVYQYMQNAEYLDSQLFTRCAETAFGAVTCLPGALSFVKMEYLEKVAEAYYYSDKAEAELSTFKFHRYTLGEDRYLTYLLTKAGTKLHQIGYAPNAVCKTDVPDNFSTFLKQRRRWMLGSLACEVYMLTSPLMWRRLPLVQLFKIFVYVCRSVDWMGWVLVVSLIANFDEIESNWYYLSFAVAVLLKYFLFVAFCLCSNRKKPCLFYILQMIFMPVFTLIMCVYSVFTWNVRTWGGPRTNLSKDQHSVMQVLAKVMEKAKSEVQITGLEEKKLPTSEQD